VQGVKFIEITSRCRSPY